MRMLVTHATSLFAVSSIPATSLQTDPGCTNHHSLSSYEIVASEVEASKKVLFVQPCGHMRAT